jgi:hypothetical protein
MNAMPKLTGDTVLRSVNHDDQEKLLLGEIQRMLDVNKGSIPGATASLVPLLAVRRPLLYAAIRKLIRLWLKELNDEAAGQGARASNGQPGFARSSSAHDGGDGHTHRAGNGQTPTASPPSPNADGKGQSSTASNGQDGYAHPSAPERDDEATLDAPANPGLGTIASSSLHVRERGGPLTSAGNGRQPASLPQPT